MVYNYKKQVSIDSLLGVHEVHDITCPKINALQFDKRNATKIYEEDLEQDPENLKINLNALFKSMNDLDQWANDIIKLVNELPENLYNSVLGEVFNYETDYEKLINKLETDYRQEIKEYATELNALIEQWQDYRQSLEETKEETLKQQKLLEKEEKDLLFLKIKGENTDEVLALIDFYKNEVSEQQEKKAEIFNCFEKYIKDDFKKQAKEFSSFLESVRERNDDVRCTIGEIKYQIASKAKIFLNLYQPDEYLDIKFGIKNKEANLGVLFNDTITEERNEFVNFNSFLIAARSKQFITFEQMNKIIDLKENFNISFRDERKSLLLDILKDNGFTKVRYYNDQKEYASNREHFTTEELNKPIAKLKNT